MRIRYQFDEYELKNLEDILQNCSEENRKHIESIDKNAQEMSIEALTKIETAKSRLTNF